MTVPLSGDFGIFPRFCSGARSCQTIDFLDKCDGLFDCFDRKTKFMVSCKF